MLRFGGFAKVPHGDLRFSLSPLGSRSFATSIFRGQCGDIYTYIYIYIYIFIFVYLYIYLFIYIFISYIHTHILYVIYIHTYNIYIYILHGAVFGLTIL